MQRTDPGSLAKRLATVGCVELEQPPRRVLGLSFGQPETVLVVSTDGVRLVERDLHLPWDVLGPVFGWSGEELDFGVSAPFWEAHIKQASGAERRRAILERKGLPTVALPCRLDTESVATWLTNEIQQRAAVPAQICQTPTGSRASPLMDVDTRRAVPLDRLALSPQLRENVERWNTRADEVPESELGLSESWEAFAPEGRHLAIQLEQELRGRAKVGYWADLPGVS